MSELEIRVTRPWIPFLPRYCVVSIVGGRSDADAVSELWARAHRIARREAARAYDDPEAFTLLFNAGRTRRRMHPHVHVVLAASVRDKRRAMFWLALKHVTRALLGPSRRRRLRDAPAPRGLPP